FNKSNRKALLVRAFFMGRHPDKSGSGYPLYPQQFRLAEFVGGCRSYPCRNKTPKGFETRNETNFDKFMSQSSKTTKGFESLSGLD
ncbi:MAG: hypothetical protein Q8J97_09435, partial [Flavobacteriaceae bacterium]|nr:hypothetical protein [Flavobacteriaceae bacterium]